MLRATEILGYITAIFWFLLGTLTIYSMIEYETGYLVNSISAMIFMLCSWVFLMRTRGLFKLRYIRNLKSFILYDFIIQIAIFLLALLLLSLGAYRVFIEHSAIFD